MNHKLTIYDWYSENINSDYDEDNEDNEEKKNISKFKIFIFGKNEQNESICIKVNNFTPYLYLKVPNKWSNTDCKQLIKKIKKYFNKNIDLTYYIEKCKIFRGFNNNNTSKFIRLIFQNTYDMRKTISLFEKRTYLIEIIKNNNEKITGYTKNSNYDLLENIEIRENNKNIIVNRKFIKKINFIKKKVEPNKFIKELNINNNNSVDLFESNIDPILRFLHIQELDPCCKVSVPVSNKLDYPIYSNCKHEYDMEWDDIQIIKEQKDMNILTKTLAFDIECYSSHGDFPKAKKNWDKPVKDIIKYSRKNTIDFEFLDTMFKTIPYNKYKSVNQIHIKEVAIDYYLFLDKELIIIETIKIFYLIDIINQIISKKKNKLVLLSEIENNLDIKLTDSSFLEFEKYIKIFEKVSFKIIEDINDNTDNTIYLSIEYNSLKNPITFAEIYLTDLYNNYFILEDNKSIIKGDEVIQIGSCFNIQNERECYKKNIITLDTCSKFDDTTEIIQFKVSKEKKLKNYYDEEEKKVLLAWKDLILKEDPDFITGFNIFDFDIPYLFERAEELDIIDQFSEISRIQNKVCTLKYKGGKLNTKFVDIPGRIQFDIYKVVKDFNLDSYKLDNVASHFIRGKVIRFENDKKSIYVDNTVGLKIGNYVKLKQKKGYDDINIGNKNKYLITNITDSIISFKEPIENVELDISNISWSLGKDDVSAKDIFRFQRMGPKERGVVAKYCIMDVVLCIELMNKLQIIQNNIGMSNVCSTPLNWIFTRGQGIRCLSLVSKECRKLNYLLPTLYPDTFDSSGYEGACVLDAKSGIYIKPIVTLDYASLYPRSMLSANISHETCVIDSIYKGDEGAKRLNELGYDFHDISYDNYIYKNNKKVSIGKSTERFVKKRNGKKGIIPVILDKLLNARKFTRNKIKFQTITLNNSDIFIGIIQSKNEETTKIKLENQELKEILNKDIKSINDTYSIFQKQMLDCYQLAYKLVSNSIYGQIGARTSAIYWKSLAASTTAIGRDQLFIAKEFIERNYEGSRIVYGDTDSVFIDFNFKLSKDYTENIKKAITLGKEAGVKISKILLQPQDLEYEKVFFPFILLSKKKYVGNKYEEDPYKYKQTSMGIVLKRRDNAPILKQIYGNIIDSIMINKSIKPAIDYLRLSLRNVINGNFDIDKFIVSKTLNDNYKNPEMIAHNVLADRIAKRTGKKPQIQDRIGYIYIETKDSNCLQGDKIETKEFIIENKLKIDYYFYITNQIMKPVCQIFALEIENIKGFQYHNNYFKELEKKLNKQLKDKDKINEKIKMERQKQAENILFYDIKRFNENKKNNTSEITKWFSKKI